MQRRHRRAGPTRSSAARLALLLALSPVLPPALVGCAASGDGAHPLPEGVTAQLVQLRSDVAARQAEVRIVNGSDAALEVGEVSVVDPRFRAPAERVVDRTSTLAPGAGVDVRVQLAPVDCAARGDAQATLTLRGAHGTAPFTATEPVTEAIPFLAALHERECVQEGAQRSADVALGAFSPSDAGRPAALELVVTPRPGTGGLRIVGIRETNLLTFERIGSDGVHRLAVDQTGTDRAAVTVALALEPARCDPHAVQEDKRGTVFRLLVEVDGVAGTFDLAASSDLRADLLAWVAKWCGYGP